MSIRLQLAALVGVLAFGVQDGGAQTLVDPRVSMERNAHAGIVSRSPRRTGPKRRDGWSR